MSEEKTAFNQFVTFQIVRLANKYERHADAYLKEFPGMSGKKWRLLVHISQYQQNQPADIAAVMNLDMGMVIGLLSEMCYDGYLASENGSDGIEYLLTDAGVELYETLRPFMQNRQSKLLEGIDQDQLALFHATLNKLHKNTNDLLGDHDL